jgi:F-type H+-transporting ATPase subunit gamma
MPSMKDIRKKISSTKNTQQITKAMKMVSAAKLRRAQMAVVSARPYAYKIHSVISRIASSGEYSHPLLLKSEKNSRALMVVLTSDRGLCGAFNSNIIKYTDRFYKENKVKFEALDFIFVGRKAFDFFKKRDVKTVETITNLSGLVSFKMATELAEKIIADFTTGSYNEVYLVYNEFRSAISQKVIADKVLPVGALPKEESEAEKTLDSALTHYIFEPGANKILETLVPKHFAIQIYRAMLESVASEHGARMAAMDSATRNAGQMIRKLTLTYNKLRQAAITKELMEIVSGAEALK